MKTYSVPDMSCGHCKASILEALGKAAPQAAVSVDLEARRISVDDSLDASVVVATLDEIGFDAAPV